MALEKPIIPAVQTIQSSNLVLSLCWQFDLVFLFPFSIIMILGFLMDSETVQRRDKYNARKDDYIVRTILRKA